MTDKELMQDVLDTMEAAIKAGDWKVDGACDPDYVLEALRARLAQPNEFNPDWDAMAVIVEEQQRMAKRIAELEAQPEPEPVAWIIEAGGGLERYLVFGKPEYYKGTPLYATPPQREWVGLTDEEKEHYRRLGLVGVEIIEAKLKEKNT